MKRTASCLLLFGLILLSAATAFSADEEFHLTYEQKTLSTESESASGVLLVHVANNSGVDARDVVVWIPGANKVTFDNRTIFVGNLSAGEVKGVMDEWTVPAQLTGIDLPDGDVTWRVEYTNAGGDRIVTDVVGEQIQ